MSSLEELESIYKALADRNNWKFSWNGEVGKRPYFMNNGNYAVPDETTTLEDKELLAEIISEGSDEMKKLIIECWDNGIKISGPCSGIKEYHQNQPDYLHFTFISPEDIILPLCQNLKVVFPNFNHLCRSIGNDTRYDINYFLNGKDLSKEEADTIFAIMREQLNLVLSSNKVIKKH